jgi:quercetin dioxygenase-like cupin family protein
MSERRHTSNRARGLAALSRRRVLIAGASLAAAPVLAGMATAAQAQQTQAPGGRSMEIWPNGSRPSAKGAAEYFTGSVVVDPLYAANESTSSTGGLVTFEPGARSAWHTNPSGQILIVTSGTGWVQEEGGEKREVKPGDTRCKTPEPR